VRKVCLVAPNLFAIFTSFVWIGLKVSRMYFNMTIFVSVVLLGKIRLSYWVGLYVIKVLHNCSGEFELFFMTSLEIAIFRYSTFHAVYSFLIVIFNRNVA